MVNETIPISITDISRSDINDIEFTFKETLNLINNIQQIIINTSFIDNSFIISNNIVKSDTTIESIQEEIEKIQQDIEKIQKENEKTQKEILFIKQEKEKQEIIKKEILRKEKPARFLAIDGVITFKSISLEQPTARNAALRCLPNTAVSQFNIEAGGSFERFYSIEHYLLYCKAKLYNHRYVLNYLKENFDVYCPSFPDQKWENTLKLISKLNSFIDISNGKWDAVKEEALNRGLLAKFTQNAAYKRVLLDTGDSILAYLTLDSYLGIGREDYDGGEWSGENVLGEVLMNVREFIRDAM